MSDTETTVPATEALFEVVGSSDAAVARVDQAEAALRDMTSDRDNWRSAAENLRTELWRQMDMMRAEHVQHGEQIAHLTAAMNALIEIAESRQVSHLDEAGTESVAGPVVKAAPIRETLAELPPLPEIVMPAPIAVAAAALVAPVAATSTVEEPELELEPLPTVVRLAPDVHTPVAAATTSDAGRDPFKVNAPAAVVAEPVAEVAPTEVVVPVEAPAPVMNAYVPADDSKDVGHLAAQSDSETSEPVIVDGDRVGAFTELAAFAEDSEPEFGPSTAGPAKPEVMNVLPTPVVEAPKKRQLRLPRLSG